MSTDLEVFGFTLIEDGKRTTIPPAIEHWKKSMVTIEILQTGKSDGYAQYEFITTNLTIVILVTGFENYCKVRFMELERDKAKFEYDAILKECLTKKDFEIGYPKMIEERANENKITKIQQLIKENRLRFQDYKQCRRMFEKGFGIKFDELGIVGTDIEKIKKNFGYRHRIIHVDPMLQPLNELELPRPDKVIFPTRQYANETKDLFDRFIQTIHKKTIELIQ